MKALITILATALLVVAPSVRADTGNLNLPDLGSAGADVISPSQQYHLGRRVVTQLRNAGAILEDPEITDYLQSIGHQLSSHAHQTDNEQFSFFLVKSRSINAFALPGGFIGVNAGLLMATDNENELAGVMAHETAHVVQHHMARQAEASSTMNLVNAAAMLGAILAGAHSGNPDVVQAGIAAAAGNAAQQQLNFTRANEYEADRVGIGILARSGFDPEGMISFFEKLDRRSQISGDSVPEFLRTHPLSSNRVSEAENRARDYGSIHHASSRDYYLMRARTRVLTTGNLAATLNWFEHEPSQGNDPAAQAVRYGLALTRIQLGRPQQAIDELQALANAHEDNIHYRIALAEAQAAAGHNPDAIATLREALRLTPDNVPLTEHYARILMQSGQAGQAEQVLSNLLAKVETEPHQARMLAQAANDAGNLGEAHYYMSDYYLLNGQLPAAIEQIQLALDVPSIDSYQRARYQARLDRLRSYLPRYRDNHRKQRGDGDGD
ncbi:MAG: M48 family metalloprotease [Gammaproteobacteria bacterium]